MFKRPEPEFCALPSEEYDFFDLYIIKCWLDFKEKETEKSVYIPSHAYPLLIGKEGEEVQQLERIHHVKVSFLDLKDRAVVKGSREDVEEAIKELRQV